MTPLPLRADYASLPDRFRAAQAPDPVTDPNIIRVNDGLAEALGLATAQLTPKLLAGNSVTEGSTPIAMAYAGHQFGNFVPQLGDGRAVLLGEIVAPDGTIFDVQLKGSGRTPFSRSGDGRAWLGPVLREYIVSEAMAALGIPTTRALAAVTTGETVYREAAMPGAILTRVAKSHIRVGTFQFFAARDDQEGIKTLLAFAIQRLYPDLAPDDAAGFLAAVAARQADLVAKWMGVGFIHGVMNTDNMALSGETIDYGPCAFMDAFHPETVFSSIDQMGRYAWRNQPGIAQWNLAQLATCLIPHLAGGDMDKGLEVAQTIIDRFPGQYQDAYLAVFREKLGLRGGEVEEDAALIEDFLRRLAEEKRDFTNSFRALADQPDWLGDWRPRWEAARSDDWQERTRTANPAVIPRNHQIEAAITAAVAGDVAPFHRLVDVLATPFALAPEHADLANPPAPEERVLQTFCGT